MSAGQRSSVLRGLLLFLLGGLIGANATYFLMTRNSSQPVLPVTTDAVSSPPPADASQHDSVPTLPLPVPAMRGIGANTAAASGNLLIPVQGVLATQLSDTFTDARSADRVHDAIDIMAPAGTPVLAVADGHVEKLFTSKLGGLTIYEFNRDGTLAYYYAHLQRYADGLAEQQQIRRGQVIGNAPDDVPHLHFAIFELGPDKQWWQGEAVNPYPRLVATPR